MRYVLVATSSWLLLVDLQSRQVQPLEHHRPEYYGISWFQDGDGLVLSHSGVDNSTLVDIASYAQSERGWLSHALTDSRKFLSSPHQILCATDGRIICANTGRNVVTVLDPAKPTHFQEAGISSARWDRLTLEQPIGDHLNSVYLKDERLYVMAHAHSSGSKLAVFSYPDLELIEIDSLGKRTGLHNIWITDQGQRISCHSENGSLIDLDEKQALWESGSAVYTRGLAASEQYVIVGESQKTGRDLRRSSMCGIWILDRHTWQADDYLCLGPYGAINEVRLLDTPDHAHHGSPFKGLQSLLSKDVRIDQSQHRMNTASIAFRTRHLWDEFEVVFGSPEAWIDGARRSSIDQLCLAIRKSTNDTLLTFSYSIESTPIAHVSAVIGYKGLGADTHMAALLIQPIEDSAALTVWTHDGNSWVLLEGIYMGGIPQAGTLHLATSPQDAVLSINGDQVITLKAEALGLKRCDEGLGIRWTGASVCLTEAVA
ncbi:hypothetical protein PHLH8_56840 [Pseudomonas sp. Pc102]|uniref:hypothetical protein n=1 Tax=Pseudomonas sp. Pc102 TaxID=2678261 RepID=UPI001BD11EE1|nr:hypothetical protein [Pseudomonas sp. Pc102]BBP86042.1 hypothetical protein PHLH8_56840 [Pseudomonas sp. Pc102]